MPPKTQIPVTILTGFLGAGKTTLLNHILHSDLDVKVAILVNDFGKINIDSQLILEVGADDTIELSNGCICCTIRGDLLNALVKLIEREHPPEYIIIEASGVSDPLEIAMTFRQPRLSSYITVDSVLTVIDAEQTLNLEGENKVMAVLQVGAADMIILNKVDLVDESQCERVKQWIYSIIGDARIIRTVNGRAPVDLILGTGAFKMDRLQTHKSNSVHVHDTNTSHDDHHHHRHDLVFTTWSWQSDQPLAMKALKRAIDQLPNGIFRAKGIVYLADDPTRIAHLQVVGRRASINWGDLWGKTEPSTQIVVIGDETSVDDASLNTSFEQALATNAPKSDVDRLTRGVLNWLRTKLS